TSRPAGWVGMQIETAGRLSQPTSSSRSFLTNMGRPRREGFTFPTRDPRLLFLLRAAGLASRTAVNPPAAPTPFPLVVAPAPPAFQHSGAPAPPPPLVAPPRPRGAARPRRPRRRAGLRHEDRRHR